MVMVKGQPGRSSVRSICSALIWAIGLLAGTQAAASPYASRNVGRWIIAASRDGTGCFLTRAYDRAGGTTLLFGLDADGTNRLTVLNANWSIEPQDRLELTFRLSGASFPKHVAIGLASDGKKGFVTSFGGTFPTHFAASRTLQIFRGDVPVEQLTLDGSGAAIAELRMCIDAQRSGTAGSDRGKEPSGTIPKDPFAQPTEGKRKK